MTEASPTIAEFEQREAADRSAWWRLSAAATMRLFDEAREEIKELRAAIERAGLTLLEGDFTRRGGETSRFYIAFDSRRGSVPDVDDD